MHSRMTSAHAKRLTQEDWLIAGMAALAEQGPEALKAEPAVNAIIDGDPMTTITDTEKVVLVMKTGEVVYTAE